MFFDSRLIEDTLYYIQNAYQCVNNGILAKAVLALTKCVRLCQSECGDEVASLVPITSHVLLLLLSEIKNA